MPPKTETRGNKTTFVTSLYLWGQKVSLRLPSDFLPTYEAGKRMAEEEGTTISKLMERAFEDTIIRRGLDKKDAKLTEWQDNPTYKAFPNAYAVLTEGDLKDCSRQELEQMIALLEHNIAILRTRIISEAPKPEQKKPRYDEGDVNWMVSHYHLTREEAIGHLSQEKVLDVDAIKLSRESGDSIEECQRYLRARREAQDAQAEREKQRRVVQWRAIK